MTDRTQAEPLRLSMTLPGSASLGAYQAGAVAALAVVIDALRAEGQEVHLDAIGGSSAGSFVAMLFTHCLLTGRDAPSLLGEAWIDEVDLELLRSGGSEAPLAVNDLRDKMELFLSDVEAHPYGEHEPLTEPVVMHIGLTSLLGFTAEVDDGGRPTSALSFVDWVQFRLEPDHEPEALWGERDASLLDAVMASATHPAGFRPRLLDRSADRHEYEQRGVQNFPESGRLWYTDGGLIESRPIGRIIAAARARTEGDSGRRIHLVIDPRSSGPSGDERWSDPEADPSWLDGLRRAASIVPTQALHDDLRRVASLNNRLRRLDELVEELAADGLDPDEIRPRLAAVGDLEGKEIVAVEMISPLLLAEDAEDIDHDGDGVNDLLAGDFIAAFGGFLDVDIRRSDFALGWKSTSRWIEEGLARLGVEDALCESARKAVDDARPDRLEGALLEQTGVDQLSASGRWQLALLGAQFGRVLINEALPGLPSRPAVLDRWRS